MIPNVNISIKHSGIIYPTTCLQCLYLLGESPITWMFAGISFSDITPGRLYVVEDMNNQSVSKNALCISRCLDQPCRTSYAMFLIDGQLFGGTMYSGTTV